MANFMNRVKTILHTWRFLYRYEKYGILWGVALVATGLYPAITALISKEVINSILTPGPNLISRLPNAFFFGIVYGVITLLHGIINSYSAHVCSGFGMGGGVAVDHGRQASVRRAVAPCSPGRCRPRTAAQASELLRPKPI
jgi:hypothetical protein